MSITKLQDLARRQVESLLPPTEGDPVIEMAARQSLQRQLLNKVRRPLWTITCQQDVVEMTGVIEDFGGDKDVKTNICKAVFHLLCFASLHRLNLSEEMDKLVAETTAKLDKAKSPSGSAGTAPVEGKDAQKAGSDSPAEGGPEAAEVDSPAGKPETTGASTKGCDSATSSGEATAVSGGSQKLAAYEKNLRGAKTKAAITAVWNREITVDPELSGKEKGVLCKVFQECRKALKQ